MNELTVTKSLMRNIQTQIKLIHQCLKYHRSKEQIQQLLAREKELKEREYILSKKESSLLTEKYLTERKPKRTLSLNKRKIKNAHATN